MVVILVIGVLVVIGNLLRIKLVVSLIDDTDRKILQMSGDTVFTRQGGLASPDEYVKEYNPNNVEVGVTDEGKKFSFDFSTGLRACLITPVGGGKTFTIQAVTERVHKSGKFSVVILPDVKDEFSGMVKKAPQKQYQFYNTGEKPEGFPLISFKPNFFKTFRVPFPKSKNCFKLGFSVDDLNYSDVLDIFKINDLSPLQQALIQEMALKIQTGKLKISEYSQIIDYIEKFGKTLNVASRNNLKLKLKFFFDMKFFSEPVYNIVDILNKGYIVALNMEGFDNVGKDNGAPQVAVSIVHRVVFNARKTNELKKKKILIIMDEANRFVPAERQTGTKQDILESVEVSRAYGVSYFFAYQTVATVPPSILQNSRYIMVAQSAGTMAFVEAIKSSGIYRRALNTLQTHVARLKQRMTNFTILHEGKEKNIGRYCWLVIDKMQNRADIVYFYTPMSYKSVK